MIDSFSCRNIQTYVHYVVMVVGWVASRSAPPSFQRSMKSWVGPCSKNQRRDGRLSLPEFGPSSGLQSIQGKRPNEAHLIVLNDQVMSTINVL